MFRALKNWLSNAATSLATKYALRASIAVPLLIAAGFAVAGVTVHVVDAFGARLGYFLMAGGFAAFGLLAGLLVWWRERSNDEGAETSDSSLAAQTAAQVVAAVPAASARKTEPAAGVGGFAWSLLAACLLVVILASQGRALERRY